MGHNQSATSGIHKRSGVVWVFIYWYVNYWRKKIDWIPQVDTLISTKLRVTKAHEPHLSKFTLVGERMKLKLLDSFHYTYFTCKDTTPGLLAPIESSSISASGARMWESNPCTYILCRPPFCDMMGTAKFIQCYENKQHHFNCLRSYITVRYIATLP